MRAALLAALLGLLPAAALAQTTYYVNALANTNVGLDGTTNMPTLVDVTVTGGTTNANRAMTNTTAPTGTVRWRLSEAAADTRTAQEFFRAYTPAFAGATTFAANATAYADLYMRATGGTATARASLYEYNATTGAVGAAKGTATFTVNTAVTTRQTMNNVSFANAQFSIAAGNRLLVVYAFDMGASRPSFLWGQGVSATPSGYQSFTVTTVAAVNTTATGTVTATPSGCTGIAVSAPYTNDANANNTLSYRYRTPTGTGAWSGTFNLAHSASPYAFAISGLVSGSAYDVEATYLDADGVTGTALQTVSNVLVGGACTRAGTVTVTNAAGATPSLAVSAPYTGDSNANNTGSHRTRTPSGTGAWTAPTTLTHAASPYTATLTGLTCGATYDVEFTYADADGIGSGTAVQTVTAVQPTNCTVAGTPTGTADTCTQVTVSAPFTQNLNGSGSTLFERGPSATGPWTGVTGCAAVAGASPRTCVDNTVVASTTYYYRVTFADADGLSGTNPAVTAAVPTGPCAAPQVTPGVLTASVATCTSAYLNAPFTGDSDGDSTATFSSGPTAGGPWTTACAGVTGSSPRSCVASPLSQATAYYFKADFADPDGVTGGTSQTIGPFTTYDCRTVAGAPVAVVNGCSQITVSAPWSGDWNSSSSTAFGRGTALAGPFTAVPGCGAVSGASPRTCANSGLTGSTAYYYQVTVNDADGVTGTNPSAIGPFSTTACAGNLALSGTPQPAGAGVAAGTTGTSVGKLTLTSSAATATLTELRLANTGTAQPGTDVQDLVVYDDVNLNGTYEPATDTTVVGVATWNATRARYVMSSSSYGVTAGTPRNLFVTLDTSSSAATGVTFILNVASTDLVVTAPSLVTGGPVVGNTFTVTAGPPQGGSALTPMVLILNPSEGATVSGAFRVQVQVFNPGGAALTALALSTNAGTTYTAYTFNLVADVRPAYSVGANAAVYETTLTLARGAYSLKARGTNASGSGTSGTVVVGVNAAGAGDGNLLVRDNGSQLCLDCHALATHSSQTTSAQYGSWAMSCRTCHQPHSTKNIYLVKPQVATPSSGGKAVVFYNTAGRAANSYATSTGPAVPGTGICEVCHTRTANSPVAGAATATFTAGGASVTCVGGCGWTAALVGSLVKQSADPASAWTLVTAATATTLTLETGGYRGTAGVGVAYATRSPRYRNTGDNGLHYTTDCTACHAHSGGFASSSCLQCHGTTGVETEDLGVSFWNNAIKATINTDEWTWSGHGKTAGTYDVTANPAAALPTAPSPGTSECLYCHDDGVAHSDATNPFRLRGASVSGGATGAYSTAAPNATCLNCHLTASFGVTPGGQTNKNGTQKSDAAHDGLKHAAATLGGKFCWDCHEPHGDRSSAPLGNITMVRSSVQAVTDGTFGYLGAAGVARPVTYNARTATPPAVGKAVETTTAAGTQHVGLCQACHGDTSETNWTKYWNRLGYDDSTGPPNTDRVASAHNSGSATTPYCVSCHPHAQKFAGQGTCVDCHASPQPITVGPLAGTRSRRAIVPEFALAWSHKRSAAGAVTRFDCIVCHMEGDMTTGDATAVHQNGVLDLRDPDTGLTIKGTTWSGAGAGAYAPTAVDAAPAEFSRNLASATIEPDMAAIMMNQCLKCHDANGALSTSARVPTTGTAEKPFGTTIAGAAYTGLGVTANGVLGGVTDVNESFKVTNSSYHPVAGKQNNWYAKLTRMAVPWNAATRGAAVDVTSWGPLLTCWDCHAPPGATGVQIASTTAHGAAATLRGTATTSGTNPTTANAVTLCPICHAGYSTNTASNHGAGSALSGSTDNGMTAYLRYGCNICHSSGYNTAVARPVRAQDVHGVNALPTTGIAKTSRWATAGAVPIAFIRDTQVLPNHQPARIGATAYTPNCMGGNVAPCSQGSQNYTVGGTY